MEFTCLDPDCANAPLMCYICKDYGRHKGHNHNLLELEAEKMRQTMSNACTQLKKFMEDVSETSRRLGKKIKLFPHIGRAIVQMRFNQCHVPHFFNFV